jgi:hypothetical protein
MPDATRGRAVSGSGGPAEARAVPAPAAAIPIAATVASVPSVAGAAADPGRRSGLRPPVGVGRAGRRGGTIRITGTPGRGTTVDRRTPVLGSRCSVDQGDAGVVA